MSKALALAAICDTLLPSIARADDPDGYWARRASDLDIPEKIIALAHTLKTEDRAQLEQLFGLLATPLLGLTWLGPLKPAHQLSPAQRETLLRRWANSPLPPLRNAFNVLRKITAILYYGDVPPAKQANPNWQTIGYQNITEFIRPDPDPLPLAHLESDTTLDCEILVIGSGAGGSLVAAQLAAAGRDVLVVEKGGYARTDQFTQQEFPMLHRHFEAGGLLTSHSGSVSVLAGSTLGGGTTINWAGSLRTPDYVLEEWAAEHTNPHFREAAYREGFDFVEKRNSVGTDFRHNPQNQALLNAAHALGYHAENIPMNLRFPDHLPPETAWKATGFSCYGDAYGIKQGAAQTFLRDAVKHGARLLVDVDIQRIVIKNGEAAGAEGLLKPRHSEAGEVLGGRTVRIRAQKVVVAAGALHTPVLLRKSGLAHPHIGRNLWLHPVAAVAAFHTEDTLPWYGPMMSVIVQEFARLDGNWGVRIECPPIHPGLAAFALSWEGGEQFKRDLAEVRRLAVHICLTRDRFGGRVEVGKHSGQPVVHYELSRYDRAHLLRGLAESVRLHAAAGAERVAVLHNQTLHFSPKRDRIEDFLPKIAAHDWSSNRFGLFSAHQMGTCRMGGTRDYPVQPNGETREVRGLFVADASLFPSASGANPMLSIQALAYWVARQV
jgi:choline dehydrogenase-like flavoprotein